MTDPPPVTINGKTWIYNARTRTHQPAGQDRHHDTDQVADLESNTRDESVAEKQALPFNTPVRLTVVSYRSRLADTDGVSAKAAIDGIVQAGILRDDSAKEVAEVRYRQIKVKSEADEKTEIIIERVAE